MKNPCRNTIKDIIIETLKNGNWKTNIKKQQIERKKERWKQN